MTTNARSAAVPLWVEEHGPGFDVPDAIAKAEGIVDLSWHNDVAPAFGMVYDEPALTVRIWVGHPDPDVREYGGEPRYYVIADADDDDAEAILDVAGLPNGTAGDEGLWTDDAHEALRELLRQLSRIQPAIAAQQRRAS